MENGPDSNSRHLAARQGVYWKHMPALISVFDASVEQFFALHREPHLTDFFIWITSLGDARIIAIMVAGMAFVLLRHHRSAFVAGLSVSLFGTLASSYLIKLIVARGRPLPSLAAIDAPGFSFPSMHAAVSLAVYGFLAFMFLSLLHPPRHRAATVAATAALIALIGLSRLYLGVHYPSDVAAGFAIGAAFLCLGIAVTKNLDRRTRGALWRTGFRVSKK